MKSNINEFKDRMTCPIAATRIDPKTKKPIESKPTVKKTGKKK